MSTAVQSEPIAPPSPTSPAPAPAVVPAVADRLYRLTVAQYHAMADAGILGEKDRVVLIEGLLVAKMTKLQPHIIATGLTQDALTQALPAGWYVEGREPITIEAIQSAPEPDVKVVRGTRRDYRNRRVTPADVALVVEVADSSVRDDQTTMKAIYASASIPSYWLLNLPAHRLEVYSDPTGPDPTPDYRRRADLGPDADAPLILDGVEVARINVRDLLP